MTNNLKPETKRAYRHWCKKLLEYAGKRSIKQITQYEIDAFFAWMARDMEYPRDTTNQAKIAIKHYAKANGMMFDIKTVSARRASKRPELISSSQAERVINHLEEPYKTIAESVFHGCEPPSIVCARTPSRLAGTLHTENATVAPRTFGLKLKEAASACGVIAPISPKTLQQSGIIAALQRGVERDWLLAQAQIKQQRLVYYMSLI